MSEPRTRTARAVAGVKAASRHHAAARAPGMPAPYRPRPGLSPGEQPRRTLALADLAALALLAWLLWQWLLD